MEDILRKIKSTGYWRVEIRPPIFQKDKIKHLSDLWSLIQGAHVRLRGWPYPHIDIEKRVTGTDWVGSSCDFMGFLECWRFYQSGMFIHCSACREDLIREEIVRKFYRYKDEKSFLLVLSTLFRITEIFELSMRLAQKNVLDRAAYVKIELFGAKDRILLFWDISRFLGDRYVSGSDHITMERTIPVAELMAKGHEIALEITTHLFQRFNWLEVSKDILSEDQRKFLQKRL